MNKIDHIHPPFWYAGMKWSRLQIMLHGIDIAKYDVQIDSYDVSLHSIERTENSNYLLVYLNTGGATEQTLHIVLIDKDGKAVQSIPYQLYKRQHIDIETFDAHDVVYLIVPDRWADGNANNPAKKQQMYQGMLDDRWNKDARHTDDNGYHTRHGGDIAGIVTHLDYLVDLGITALWPTPLVENNNEIYSYHGYNATNLYLIDPRLGTNEEYRNLVRQANDKGIKIIQDMVFHHISDQSFLWKDNISAKWFITDYKGIITNCRTNLQSDVHASQHDKDVFLKGWFSGCMPSFMGSNPQVQDYLIQNSLWWIEYTGINGIRQDTYTYNDYDEMARWCQAVQAEHPGYNIVGETFMNSPIAISYWQEDSPVSKRNSHLPTVMDTPLKELLCHVCDEETSDWNWGLSSIQEYLADECIFAHPDHLLTYISNHDTNRFTTSWDQGSNNVRYKQALTILLTIRGIPQLYYGDEISMVGFKDDTDFTQRQNFPGGFPDDFVDVFRGTNMHSQMWEYFNFTRKMLNWRKQPEINRIIAEGDFIQHTICNGIYVYARTFEGHIITIMLNGTWETRTVNPAQYADVMPKPYAHDFLSGRFFSTKKDITMNPRDIFIFDWDLQRFS